MIKRVLLFLITLYTAITMFNTGGIYNEVEIMKNIAILEYCNNYPTAQLKVDGEVIVDCKDIALEEDKDLTDGD